MLYIFAKFREIILNGIDRADTISILKSTKGNNSAKIWVDLCMSSGHALYFYQVL